MEITQVLTDLKSKGFKLTSARIDIIKLLLNSSQPLSAAEIFTTLSKQSVGADRATVYRQITFLINQAIISELDFGEGKKRYEFNFKKHHHHLLCVNCGLVEDFELKTDLLEEEKRIAKNRRFKVINHSLEFFGLCQKCN